MSSFIEKQINNMTLEEIDKNLNSNKYMSAIKKEKLIERKLLLESKDLTLSTNFPPLNNSSKSLNLEPEPEPEP